MSDEGDNTSPTLLNLRGFRIQKKAGLSHHRSDQSNDSSTEDNDLASPPAAEQPPLSPPLNNSKASSSSTSIRRRIIVVSDSGSEGSDTPSLVSLARDDGDVKLVEAAASAPSPIKTSPSPIRPGKTEAIIEKEKQMQFLIQSFPTVDTMIIHDVLSRYDFNSDEAAAELARCHGLELLSGGYTKWRQINEEAQRKVNETQCNNNTDGLTQCIKRKFQSSPSVTNYAPHSNNNKRRRIKRRRSDDEDDSDDSGASRGHYRNEQHVYDSDGDSDVEINNELTGDKLRVFDFLQTGTMNELKLMNSCSKKKAEAIIEARPFKGWIDLVKKLEDHKNLSTDILNAAQQILTTRNNIRCLMKKCTNLALQMERATVAGAGVKIQPKILSVTLNLTNYQMVGLNWLVVLHNQGVNGILADEMGLGKTVQVIAFLAHLKEIGAARSTHLVIVPSSTIENWRSEFARWCPELRIFMYYGSAEERRSFRISFSKGILADFDVILTTYTLVANSPEERKMFRVTPMHYVVFDEAHMLKNMNTQRYENLIRINARHRILLTGTPLQNNLLELMSLLIFMMPRMFAEKADDLKNLFQKNSKSSKQVDDHMPAFEMEQIQQAKRIMKPFVLRRLKCDVLQDLPKKTDHVISVAMVPTQKDQYANLVASYQKAADDDSIAYNGMSMMTDLRKLSNHPLLLRYHYDTTQLDEMAVLLAKDPLYKDTVIDYIVSDLMCMSDFELHQLTKYYRCLNDFMLPDNLIMTSGKFSYLDKMLESLKMNGNRVLIFSQYVIMLNVMEEYLRLKKYKFLRLDGSTTVSDRQPLIDEFTRDSSIFIFLLSTRAGGLGINLTSADTVIIHDIDFNPYNDKQAEDRCHRMGQTKPVTVYRLISQGTIEEGMLEMNREKLKLERDITTDETDNPDVKSVVRLLSSALGVDSSRTVGFVSPKNLTVTQ